MPCGTIFIHQAVGAAGVGNQVVRADLAARQQLDRRRVVNAGVVQDDAAHAARLADGGD
ncbi:hypothetical protein D3C80_2035960 [compost metagenome]